MKFTPFLIDYKKGYDMYETYATTAGYEQQPVVPEQDIYMSATDSGGAGGGPSWDGFKI